MPTVVPMPKLGAGVYKEGVIVKWFKAEGENVREREPLAEIETEKAVVAYESPVSGVLIKIIAAEGSTVQVGEPVCVVGERGESVPPELVRAPVGEVHHSDSMIKPAVVVAPARISPAAKRLAETMNVDLAKVIGTGPGGTVMREDVLKVARSSAESTQPVNLSSEPLSTMRATIAERLLKSQRETAHVTLTREVGVKRLVSLVKEALAGTGITYTDVMIKVAAEALRRHPGVNSRMEGDQVKKLNQININFAVSVDGGLIAPTVRVVDTLPLREVSKIVKELSERARERKLASTDYTDGTFTISNLGMFGIDAFTPIINPPQIAILGTGRILERPWVEEGQIKAIPTMHLSLTFDHRIVDGADAARFLDTIVTLLDDFAWLK